MSNDNDSSSPSSTPPPESPSRNHQGGWEVVEELSEELPSQNPPTTTQPETDLPAATPLSTFPEPELENSVSFGDNSGGSDINQPTMSPSHDYAEQHLGQFDDNPAPAGGNYPQYHYPQTPKKPPFLLIGGVGLGIIGLFLIAKLVLFKAAPAENNSTPNVLIESTSGSPTPSPVASPSPISDRFDKTRTKIQVLNGSGIVGAAGKLAQVLKDADWEKVETGNAQSYDANGVRIQVKDGQSALADALETALKDDYEDITIRETLDENSEYDTVITLGKQPEDAKTTDKVEGASDSADLKQPSDKKSD